MTLIHKYPIFSTLLLILSSLSLQSQSVSLNEKADSYSGVWYQNQILDNIYKFKYSGGLGTYCAKHQPFAVYSEKAQKTFFCFGGVKQGYTERYDLSKAGLDRLDLDDALHHMVSYYDHKTGKVPRPTILLNKKTTDAHDNPVISIDTAGYIWIFSTSHGTSRPSYIHRSKKPYDISAFEQITPTYQQNGQVLPLDNFSYMQAWQVPGKGFACFFTKYNQPAKRTNYFLHSEDGIHWGELRALAAIDEGHYQISAVSDRAIGSAFNYHPQGQGLNWRTNLYYIQSLDMGKSWQNIAGQSLEMPLTLAKNPALVYDYEAEGLKVYLKDIRYDEQNHPIILYLTSNGYKSGPESGPRTWTVAHWTGKSWNINPITTSDSNYDMGSLWIDQKGKWQLIAPTEKGPQAYNPGGEVARWRSKDQGKRWKKPQMLTKHSKFNHTYVRRPVQAHPDFWAFWADGHGREPSESRLYFSNRKGEVFQLPIEMKEDFQKPKRVNFK